MGINGEARDAFTLKENFLGRLLMSLTVRTNPLKFSEGKKKKKQRDTKD